MFFQDHEKQIYSPQGSDKKFDPLAIDRNLVIASDGRLNDLLKQWRASSDGLGDVSKDSQRNNAIQSAMAEEALARAARLVFGLPDFPDCTDAAALEWLCDYLDYMEGKGQRGKTPPHSSESSPECSAA